VKTIIGDRRRCSTNENSLLKNNRLQPNPRVINTKYVKISISRNEDTKKIERKNIKYKINQDALVGWNRALIFSR
jgi:hypothetical protein